MVTMGQLARLWLGFILDPHDSQWLYGPYRRVMVLPRPFENVQGTFKVCFRPLELH